MRLFWTPTRPTTWVIEDTQGQLWLVPLRIGGWQQRQLYQDSRHDLWPADGPMRSIMAFLTRQDETSDL
jgi:hypothetical protein